LAIDFQKNLTDGKIKVLTVGDFERIVRIAAGLNGESFEMQISNNITVNVPDREDDDD
jgi:hypothetical protein